MNSSVTTFEMSNPIGKKLISASDIYKDKIKNYWKWKSTCAYMRCICIDILKENIESHHYELRIGKDFLE